MKKCLLAFIIAVLTISCLLFTGCNDDFDANTVYTVYYDLGEVKGNTKAQISKTEIKLKRGDKLTLEKPSCEGYEFLYWVLEGTDQKITDGLFRFEKDITLVAIWQSDWSGRG
jgi:hypothetical protein